MFPHPPFLRAAWPVQVRVLVVLLLYAIYLPLSGYTQSHFRFDAAEYWELSLKFTPNGGFSLLAFDDPLRGYLGPLLLLPARLLAHFTGWSIMTTSKVLGAGWAALLFGVAIPELWAQVTGRAVSGGRWLVLVGLAFAFWRGYFNFTLTDMPALALLLLSMVAAGRAGWAWAVAAGLLVAAAVNMRPVYLACVPAFGWLMCHARPMRNVWPRLAALVLGAALVLLPQLLINRLHFGQNTPLVLARLAGIQASSLYLEKMNWGLEQQKYETTYGIDYPDPAALFLDRAGSHLLREAGVSYFSTYQAYVQAMLSHPGTAVGIGARHLFNGLDIQYPTPYVKAIYQPTWGLAWLNYTMWFGVCLLLLRTSWRRWPLRRWLVVAVLLLPCLGTLPMGMECRYLLPLHLLLCAALSFGWPAEWNWEAFGRLATGRRLALLVAYFGFVGLCFVVSASAQATLEYGPRSLF
ncbi:MAG TPA: hypothetical protein VF629_08695 [Hymenobacter sp.]|jgi:hypothetical protein|uniref:hypothetical protein n=1 Tax=Hymenobacter sp. TaxID=1898978 RepID=UPI002EDB10BE